MFRKFMLTSVVIFVKPGTTAQLAAAFMITLGFMILHVTTNAYKEPDENISQLCGSLSILLTLFSGILIRDQVDEDADPYETALITVIIIGSQASVFFIFVYCLVFTGSDEPQTPAERLKEKTANAAGVVIAGQIDKHMEELLNSVESSVEQLSQDGVIPSSVCETLLALVDACRNDELEEFTSEVSNEL